MTGLHDRLSRAGGNNATAESQRVVAKRRRILLIVIVASAIALVGAIGGCLFMMRTRGVQVEVAQMRDEVGETLTMMSLGGPNEAVAKYLPSLISTIARWNHKFQGERESFRKLDKEITQVQEMDSLGMKAERWRMELEGVSTAQRNEYWQKCIKEQIDAEQKGWPNLTHKKGTAEWVQDVWKEFWYGMRFGLFWPCSVYDSMAQLVKGGPGVQDLDFGGRLRLILFPYTLSHFTMLRLAGIVFAISGIGYLMCWIGLKTRLGWMSYVGLIYFLYLLIVAAFIICLEVMG